MRNKVLYDIVKDCVCIYYHEYEILVDSNDFVHLDNNIPTVFVMDNGKGIKYAWVQYYVDGIKKRQLLHRYILNTPKHLHVDHMNSNGLDNRRSNLREVTRSENMQNKRGANRNNKSTGILNLGWWEERQQWIVNMTINGKRHKKAFHKDKKEDAIRYIDEMKKEYQPYSKEAMNNESN